MLIKSFATPDILLVYKITHPHYVIKTTQTTQDLKLTKYKHILRQFGYIILIRMWGSAMKRGKQYLYIPTYTHYIIYIYLIFTFSIYT